jgi:hypothetical protein
MLLGCRIGCGCARWSVGHGDNCPAVHKPLPLKRTMVTPEGLSKDGSASFFLILAIFLEIPPLLESPYSLSVKSPNTRLIDSTSQNNLANMIRRHP